MTKPSGNSASSSRIIRIAGTQAQLLTQPILQRRHGARMAYSVLHQLLGELLGAGPGQPATDRQGGCRTVHGNQRADHGEGDSDRGEEPICDPKRQALGLPWSTMMAATVSAATSRHVAHAAQTTARFFTGGFMRQRP